MIGTEIITCKICHEVSIINNGDYIHPMVHLRKRHNKDIQTENISLWYDYIKGVHYE